MYPQPWAVQQKEAFSCWGSLIHMPCRSCKITWGFFSSLLPLLQLKFSLLNAPARALMTNKTYGLQRCSSYVFLDIVHGKSSAQNTIRKGIIAVCFVFMYLMVTNSCN